MSHFVVIADGGITVQRKAVFRDIAEHKIPNARYLPTHMFFLSNSRIVRFLGGTKFKGMLERSAPLRLLFGRAARAAAESQKQVNLDRLFSLLSPTEENYIIFAPGLNIDWITPELMAKLRANPRCHHLIFYLVDSVVNSIHSPAMSEEKLFSLFKLFDGVYTYDAADAELYPDVMQFLDIPLWKMPDAPASAAPDADLYFCGMPKQRLGLVIAIRDRLARAGYTCRCLITRWRDHPMPEEDIEVIEWVPYDDTLDGLLRANCVLEIIAVNNRAATLRYKEAVIYNKKLLTNNPDIVGLPYYDPRWMRVFQTAEDVDPDWVHAVEPVDYGYRGDFSAETFLRRVEALTRSR